MDKFDVLRHYFGYTSFRSGQEQIIDGIISGRDALGIMPTGGGKSICYQVPALVLSGLTIVISPLISLMKDQVMALNSMNIPAECLNSSLSFEQSRYVYESLLSGRCKILYIAPERLMSESFCRILPQLSVSMVAVDEAHCISQWGNDFRPSYLKIADFIVSLPHRPIVAAFTATATERVRLDIEEKLALKAPIRVTTGFDRPNLSFEVISPKNKDTALTPLIQKFKDKSGIIYCMTRAAVEKVCELLCECGFNATRYHAGLDSDERQKNQEDFVYDRKPIMVATNAFGMGIDKSNVSFVIHYNMPLSLEAYYQEAGRAGRDGERAECILLYSKGDIYTARKLIESPVENEEITAEMRREQYKNDLKRLEKMIEYCITTKCLRGVLLGYFGQAHPESCGNCGNCHTKFIQTDITVDSQKILSCIKRAQDLLGYRVGAAMIAKILHGSSDKKILSTGLDSITTYGIMRDSKTTDIEEEIRHLLDSGYIEKDSVYGTLSLTNEARAVLFEGKRVIMESREPIKQIRPPKEKHIGSPETDEVLYERLRRLRYEIATEQDVPAYVVFSNATLADIAAKKPTSMWRFLDVLGVGKTKAELYGERFISEIKEYLEQNKQ